MAHGDAESSRRAASDAEDDADDVWADAEDHDEARDAEDADVTRSGPPEQGEQTFTTSELEVSVSSCCWTPSLCPAPGLAS